MDLNRYVGKEVLVKFVNSGHDLVCTLDGINNYGLIFSSLTTAAQARPTFENRLYPWTEIQHVDLKISDEQKRRVA